MVLRKKPVRQRSNTTSLLIRQVTFFLFVVLLFVGMIPAAFAQSIGSYNLSVKSGEAYVPLSTGTNVTAGLIWHEDYFKIPMGFTAKLGGITVSDLSVIQGGRVIGTDIAGTINGFTSFLISQLTDRGLSSDRSPIRYKVSGTAPDRIFKLEFFNAGFKEEHYTFGTLEDSVNVQYWLYETSDVFEIHYGSSKISHPSEYFYSTSVAPVIGYIADMELPALTLGKLYLLKGAIAAPAVDSVTTLSAYLATVSSYPSEGTVYHFEPRDASTSITAAEMAADLVVYPIQARDMVTIDYAGLQSATISVRDLNGNTYGSQPLVKGQNKIDLSVYASGIYLLNIKSTKANLIYKIIKQ